MFQGSPSSSGSEAFRDYEQKVLHNYKIWSKRLLGRSNWYRTITEKHFLQRSRLCFRNESSGLFCVTWNLNFLEEYWTVQSVLLLSKLKCQLWKSPYYCRRGRRKIYQIDMLALDRRKHVNMWRTVVGVSVTHYTSFHVLYRLSTMQSDHMRFFQTGNSQAQL